MKNLINKQAFTMAEAVLVMMIIGIIAVIMLTTLKPAEFKEKGLKVMADKVLNQIDNVVLRIVSDHTQAGELSGVLELDAFDSYNFFNETSKADELFKKYLTVIRKNAFDANADGTVDGRDLIRMAQSAGENYGTTLCLARHIGGNTDPFYVLKDGTEMCVFGATDGSTRPNTVIPGEPDICVTSGALGYIVFDTNGWEQEPNAEGKDIFALPLNNEGIAYDLPCD